MSKRYTDTDPEALERGETMTATPLSELKGKAILSIDTGEKLGQVDDILVDVAGLRVAAVIASLGTLLNKEKRVLPATEVTTWGRDAVLVKDDTSFRSEDELGDREKWISVGNHIKGLSLVSTSGNRLGKVDDLMVDNDGRIVAYRISEGIFGSNKRDISASTTKSIGTDAVIVDGDQI